jgi:hypothetical protein
MGRFFQADTGGTPVLRARRALRPEGPRELSPGFSPASAWVGFTPTTASPVGAEECLPISINPKHNVRRNSRDAAVKMLGIPPGT